MVFAVSHLVMPDEAVSTSVPLYRTGEEDLCLSLPKTVA